MQKIRPAKLCSDEGLEEINSESDCQIAAETLGLKWGNSWNGTNDFPKCLHAEDDRKKVYFNTSPKPARSDLNSTYAAICKGIYNLSMQKSTWILNLWLLSEMYFCSKIFRRFEMQKVYLTIQW